MNATIKISILFVLLFSTVATYSQCETYLQKAETLFSEKKYEDAKRQYSNYKECKPNASGIDEKIAECDRLQKDAESNNTSSSYHAETGTNATQAQSSSNSNTQTAVQQPAKRTKTAIGICTFTGDYNNSNIAETSTINAFTSDGRFIVSKIDNNNYGYAGNNSNTQPDVDYILTANVTTTPSQTQYFNFKGQSLPITTPESSIIAYRISNAKTGQIYVEQTVNLKKVYQLPSDVFPIQFSIKNINKKDVEIIAIGGGQVHIGDVYNVYEVSYDGGYTRKIKIGALKVTGSQGSFIECKFKDGEKEVTNRFDLLANLIVEK